MRTPKITVVGAAIFLTLAGPLRAATTSREALDFAFQFATGIRSDPDDRGKAQAAVVLEFANAGDLDTAVKQADEIEGWRRGVVYAELAPRLARQGRATEARQLLGKAEALSQQIKDWTAPRVAAHVARAYALMGDVAASARLATNLPTDEAGKPFAAQVAALVNDRRTDDALRLLQEREGTKDFEANVAIADGYLLVARHRTLASDWSRRKLALLAAGRVAARLPLLKRADVGLAVVVEFRQMNYRADARQTLQALENLVLSVPCDGEYKAPLLTQLAVAWHEMGEPDRARQLLAQAETVAVASEPLTRPGALASVAAGYAAVRQPARAHQLFRQSLDSAATLANARPRALAVVEVCRAVGRQGFVLQPEERVQLTTMFNNLRAPW